MTAPSTPAWAERRDPQLSTLFTLTLFDGHLDALCRSCEPLGRCFRITRRHFEAGQAEALNHAAECGRRT